MRLPTSMESGVARVERLLPGPAALASITVAAATLAVLASAPAPAHAAAGGAAGRTVAGQRPAATPRLAAVAPPVGRVSPSNCTSTGAAAVSCDLYAMAGSTSVLGTSIPIWGFSTTGAADSATAPGPVLVVNQHDTVSITLHDGLAGNVSLALPGQAVVSHGGGAGDDVTGVGNGGTRTYTFSADRAGTFLYEAGHTPDGARQVAMGLAGALVVLPGDGTAYGAPRTAYDDEAVLVLSEIDPALNADPQHFDMRSFRPAYQLINGKAFPETDPISTDAGHTVLLRYVNAGAQTHPMGVLGAGQVEIAQDGHLAQYSTQLTAEDVLPGATVDTLVAMPGGPQRKVAVYETSQHLDNNGQTTDSPLNLAFGGMLTFLDNNAPPPSADLVGPVASDVSVSPNPSDGLSDVTVTANLSDATTGGSNVDQAEFVVDDAVTVGAGHGVPMAGPFGTADVSGVSGTIPATPAGGSCAPDAQGVVPVALECLAAGKHKIYVRAHDAAGNWGVIDSVVFRLPKTGPATINGSIDTPVNGTVDVDLSATGDDSEAGGNITAAEYFIDTVGANGSGTAIEPNRVATVVAEDTTIPAAIVAALDEGAHHVYVHSRDSLGLWGPVLDISLDVDKTGPTADAVSIGPNPANGVVSDDSNPGCALISGELTDRDAQGGTQNVITDAEAFIDTVTGTGTGLQLLAVDGAMDSSNEAVYGLVPLSEIRALTNGDHQVFLRGKDVAGNWGDTLATKLVIDKTAPVLGALTVSPNPTNGAPTVMATASVTETGMIQSAEYWFGSNDPGPGNATATQPNLPTPTTVTLTIPTAGLPNQSNQTLHVRVMDQAGNWSAAATATFRVIQPNAIFQTNLEMGNAAWDASTGDVAITKAAAITSSLEPGSTRGLQVTLPSAANKAGYVTDNSPNQEPAYHVSFAFGRHTLSAGGSALTLFRANQKGAGAVFALQFRSHDTDSGQVRLVLYRRSGTVFGKWVTLPRGASTVQLDWTAATKGSLRLTLNGQSRQVLTGNTATNRVDSVQLGVVSGYGKTSNGRAYFDSFSSGRQHA
ncbi:MAG TPA: multicopper oxidase domain-containing protein [Jatrophihabitans sp.]|nr:multicopper oxidase domain-containing protein [Jatrophihabitans sp.]